MKGIDNNRMPFFPSNQKAQLAKKMGSLFQPKTRELATRDLSEDINLSGIGKDRDRDVVDLDTKVNLTDVSKKYARIAEEGRNLNPLENEKRLEGLKEQIKNGTYQVDYDALADKMLIEG